MDNSLEDITIYEGYDLSYDKQSLQMKQKKRSTSRGRPPKTKMTKEQVSLEKTQSRVEVVISFIIYWKICFLYVSLMFHFLSFEYVLLSILLF